MQDQTGQRVNSTLGNGSRGKHANTLASVNGGAQPLCRSAKRPMEAETERALSKPHDVNSATGYRATTRQRAVVRGATTA